MKRVESISKTILPQDMELFITRDTTEFIRDSISQIGQVAIIGGILALMILFLFLQNIRSTLIISVAIPIAVVTTFILMNSTGLTLNMMSLGGIALGVGMLLDNAIVVLENIFRHREQGTAANQAASIGTKEVSAAITASTLTTLCVFLPLLFATAGMQGIFFSQLAYTVSFSLIASLFVALTIVPVMASKFLHVKPRKEGEENGRSKIKKSFSNAFESLNNKYRDALGWALSHRLWVMIICPLILVLALALIPKLGTELMPEVDEGRISISIQLPVGTKFQITDALSKDIEKAVQESVPELQNLRTNVGSSGRWFSMSSVSHTASVDIDLVDKRLRDRSTDPYINSKG